jgi:hypothetical protein
MAALGLIRLMSIHNRLSVTGQNETDETDETGETLFFYTSERSRAGVMPSPAHSS